MKQLEDLCQNPNNWINLVSLMSKSKIGKDFKLKNYELFTDN